jgi:hypothetical protein
MYYFSHATTGVELAEGRHYWEVELLPERVVGICIGVSRPNLGPVGGRLPPQRLHRQLVYPGGC